ncbi:hypothetical protein CHS0354_040290 [Potamilus streckersoni]|uniref:Signal-induced proliferation-associated 1-like protein C-terminal domain-containing protein n=1 Tax=Potamilus streckersoni TaxID=2493646 RepID=A0AAE0S370_9BIVA|nr:hypothetical protein CHS0354_040290 [Potamilus streckersoni]
MWSSRSLMYNQIYNQGGRDWSSNTVSNTGLGRQRTGTLPSSQGGQRWAETNSSSDSGSQPNYLTSIESLYSSTPQTTRKTSAAANEYHTSIHHGNFTQELLKQSQNTKYLLSQGHESGRSGGNSANSSSNISDTSFSSGGSQTATHTQTSLAEHSGSLGSLLSRDDGAQVKKRPEHSSWQQQGRSSGGGSQSRKPHFDVSPLSSENSSPRSSNRNLSEMSSEESLSTRLRPGVTNNTTKATRSLKTSSNNLEADLIRLINPDLAESELAGMINSSTRRLPYRLKRTMSDESLHSQKGVLGSDLEANLKDVLFSTTPSRLSPAAREQTHKEQRLSPRAMMDITGPIPWRGQSGRKSPTHVSVPLPKSAASLEWASLVDVATKAIEGAETSSHKEQAPSLSSSSQSNKDTHAETLYKQNSRDRLVNTTSSSSQLVWRSVVSNPQQRIQELESKVQNLQAELEKERQENVQLEAEVQHLRAENVRLQEESQTAAAQLRRFTEWFFSTIDRQ